MPAAEAVAESARVFFALWPDDTVRAGLARSMAVLHAHYGGRRMRPETLHLTLVFVGRVEVARISELRSVAETIRIERFTVDFDVAECWRHNRIACLGAGQAPAGLLALVAALESGVQASGIDFDKRAYKPHITLLRKADCRKEGVGTGAEIPDSATLPRRRASATDKKNPALEPVDWPARDFVLVKSSLRPDGARYEELGRWPLL